MNKGNYSLVHDRLMEILRKAQQPSADFSKLSSEIMTVDYGLIFPDYLPVSNAKFAVTRCMGRQKIKKYLGNAWAVVGSCRIADSQFFDADGNLRSEYRR